MNRRFPRAVTAACAVLATLLAVAGCTATIPGVGGPAPVQHASQARNAQQLTPFLLARPDGAHPGGDAWAQEETPSIDEVVGHLYAPSDSGLAVTYLDGLGLVGVAHRNWYADGLAHSAEVFLFLFGSTQQSAEWLAREGSTLRDSGYALAIIDGLPDIVGYTFDHQAGPAQDTRYLARRGRVGMLVDYFTRGAPDQHPADEWVGGQYRRLG